MKNKISRNALARLSIVIAAFAFVIFRFLVPDVSGFIARLINTLCLFVLMVFLFLRARKWTETLKTKPLRLVVALLGVYTIMFLLFIILPPWVMDGKTEWLVIGNTGAMAMFTFSALLVIAALALTMAILWELTFLRQKRSPKFTMSSLLTVFSLMFLIDGTFTGREALEHSLYTISIGTLYTLALLGILFNTFKTAWIAFLSKKQKLNLVLGMLLLLPAVSGNLAYIWGQNEVVNTLRLFSPGLLSVLRVILIYCTSYLTVVFFVTLFNLPTSEAFQRKMIEADSLKDLNKLLARLLDFRDLAQAVTAMTARVCRSNSAWLVTGGASGFRVDATENIDIEEAQRITGLLLEAGGNHDEKVTTHHQKTIDELDINRPGGTRIKTIAVAPLHSFENTTGYLFAACKEQLGFDDDDKQIVSAFADQAAVALENAKLLEERLEKEKMEKELELAREIQQKILPQQTPQVKGLDIAAYFSPAQEVGGDYYDFFEIAPGKMGFVIADVAGKGISASLIMAEVKGIFESLAKLIDSPADLLERANEILKRSLRKNRFVTVVYGVVESETGKFRFARAGHTPVLVYTPGEEKVRSFLPSGIALGLLPAEGFDKKLEEVETTLTSGDIVVFYTDGISEAKNGELEDFGTDRLEEIIKTNSQQTAEQLVSAITNAVSEFAQDQPQHDDITLMIVRFSK